MTATLVCPACTYANHIYATVDARWNHEKQRWELLPQDMQPRLECTNCDHQFEAWPEGVRDPSEPQPTPGMDDRLSSFDYQLIADALDVLDPDGSEQTNRKSELEAWARAMAATGTGYLPKASNGAGELAAAGDALAELLEDALTTHIYDFDNGDEQPEDCGYQRGLDTWKAARATA